VKQKKVNFILPPSHLFFYYNGRVIEGEPVGEDTGLTVANACKSVSQYGGCPEALWPYDIKNMAVKPSPICYRKGKKFRITKYVQVPQTLVALQHMLIDGFPIIYGISVYSSFMSDEVARTGMVPLPDVKMETLEGGHCIVICGYDNTSKRFTCQNSWSTEWGDKGFFTIPYEYVLNPDLANDFWAFKSF
jgi:C1A family cysteine protease